MRFRQLTMDSGQLTIRNEQCTIEKSCICRGELCSPARNFVIPSRARKLGVLTEVGEDCE